MDERTLRELFDRLAAGEPVEMPAHLDQSLMSQALVGYADTAPVAVAEHLEGFVVAVTSGLEPDASAGLDLLGSAPAVLSVTEVETPEPGLYAAGHGAGHGGADTLDDGGADTLDDGAADLHFGTGITDDTHATTHADTAYDHSIGDGIDHGTDHGTEDGLPGSEPGADLHASGGSAALPHEGVEAGWEDAATDAAGHLEPQHLDEGWLDVTGPLPTLDEAAPEAAAGEDPSPHGG